MNILWPKQIQWQFCKYQKAHFEVTWSKLRFQSQVAYFIKVLRTARSIYEKLRGSLKKFQAERVSADLSRWIWDRWHRLDRKGKGESAGRLQWFRRGAMAGIQGSLPEFIVFVNPSTRKQKEYTGRRRSSCRTHLGPYREPGESGEGLPRWRKRLASARSKLRRCSG